MLPLLFRLPVKARWTVCAVSLQRAEQTPIPSGSQDDTGAFHIYQHKHTHTQTASRGGWQRGDEGQGHNANLGGPTTYVSHTLALSRSTPSFTEKRGSCKLEIRRCQVGQATSEVVSVCQSIYSYTPTPQDICLCLLIYTSLGKTSSLNKKTGLFFLPWLLM